MSLVLATCWQSANTSAHRMKLITEHLAEAAKFERLAKEESNPALREQLLKQAAAYHKLAEERAQALGQPLPPKPPKFS